MAPTLIELDGFAHQTKDLAQSGSGFNGVYDVIGNSASISFDTTNKRLAAHTASLKIIEDGVTITNIGRNFAAGNRLIVISFYFRVATAPAAVSRMYQMGGPTNVPAIRMLATGALSAGFATGTFQNTSGTYADSAWHRVDARIDVSGSTFTIDWQVDGAVQTQATLGSQTAADFTNRRYGSTAAIEVLTFWLQDFVMSATTGDYPIGDHVVLPLVTAGNGTHALGTTNPIVASTGSDMEAMVDDWDGGTPSTADYITYTSTTTGDAASDFAEITMAAPDVAFTDIWDVAGYIAGFAAGTAANTADTQVLTAHGGTLIDHIGNLIDYSGSTTVLGYYRQFLARPSGGWTNANLAAAVLQWGRSTDTSPLPRLSAVLLEYAADADGVASPAVAAAVATVPASTQAATATTSPAVAAAVGTTPAPTAQGAAITSPSVVVGVAATPAPTESGTGQVAPSTAAAVAAVPAPDVQGAAQASPAVVGAVGTIPAPSPSGTAVVSPSAVVAVADAPTPAASGVSNASPAAVTAVASLDQPTATGSAQASPAVAASVASVPAPAAQGAGVASPTTCVAVATCPDPTASGTTGATNATASPSVCAAIASVPTPSAQGGAITSPATASGTASVPSPSIAGGAATQPASVLVLAAFPLPTVRGTAVVTPGSVAAVAAVPHAFTFYRNLIVDFRQASEQTLVGTAGSSVAVGGIMESVSVGGIRREDA